MLSQSQRDLRKPWTQNTDRRLWLTNAGISTQQQHKTRQFNKLIHNIKNVW